jgi:hypothetical protein
MYDVKITITYHDGLMTWQKKRKKEASNHNQPVQKGVAALKK